MDTPSTPFVAPSRTEGLIIATVALAAAIGLGAFIGDDRGWIAGCAGGALAAMVRIAWPLRKALWFWIAMAAFAAANAFAVALIDWSFTHSWRGRSVSGLMLVDSALMMAVTYGLFCLIYGRPAEAVAEMTEQSKYSQRDLDL